MNWSNKLACELLATTAGLFIAAPAMAQSSIELYGMVDESVVYANNQNGHSNTYLAGGNLYANKFGFRGHEALSSTTSAIFDLQAGFNPSTGASQASGLIFNREAYVGLQDTRYGTITMGRQYSPYYLFVSPLTGASLGTGAASADPGDLAGLDTSIRVNSSITYTSPTIGGFAFSALVAPGGGSGSIANGSSMSAAMRYAQGPFAFAAGFTHFDNASPTSSTWSSSSTTTPNSSAVDLGYMSARSMQQISVAATYTVGPWLGSLNYTNVQFAPGAHSLFTDEAVFNSYAALLQYRFNPVVDMSGELTYETATKANGITNPADYEQISFRETVHLSKRTMLYFLQGYTHATGETLGSGGESDVIAAGPVVGDGMNLLPSTTRNQFMAMFGMAVIF